MILNKRIHKSPQEFINDILFPIEQQRKKNPKKSKKIQTKGLRCNYQIIPSPSKYTFVSEARLLCGDVVLLQENGIFVSDFCLFNKFKRYKDIAVQTIKKNEDLDITNSTKEDNRQRILQDLANCNECFGFNVWNKVIENYHFNFENLLQQYHIEQEKHSKDKKLESKNKKKAETKISKLFDKYPCIHLKRRFKEQKFQLTQISFTENFLILIGYSTESFISTIFLPSIQKDTTLDYKVVLEMMGNYFRDQTSQNYHPLKFTSSVILKCGYVSDNALKTLMM